MKTFAKKLSVMGAAVGLLLGAGSASATIVGLANNITPIFDNVTPFPATQVLAATVSTTAANQIVRIVYNAECSIGGVTTNYLDSNIIIDPAGAPAAFVAAPSNSDNALCSGNGTAAENDGWVSAVTQVYAVIPTAGIHTVRVVVTPTPGVAWRIDDQSLVVDTQ